MGFAGMVRICSPALQTVKMYKPVPGLERAVVSIAIAVSVGARVKGAPSLLATVVS